MIDPDPAAAPLSGLLVYVSSALSTPHLVYIPAQTPLPGPEEASVATLLKPAPKRKSTEAPLATGSHRGV